MAIHATNPEFGVKKTVDELRYTTPMSVLYGVTPDDKFIPVKVGDDGSLQIGTGVTLAASDLQIGAVEIKNHDTNDRVQVNTDHELLVESRLHDGDGNDITSTTISLKQGLDVNVIGGSALSVSENEDGDVPANKTSVGLLIDLNYAYDGISWKRVHSTNNRLHTDTILRDSAGTGLTSTLNSGKQSLDVNISGGVPLEVNLSQSDDSILIYGFDGSANRSIRTDADGHLQIDVLSSALPTGAATETTLSSIDSNLDVTLSTRASESTLSGFRTDFNAVNFATETTLGTLLTQTGFEARINTLGQKTSAASTPVVLSSDQSAIPITDNGGSLTVDGTVAVSNFPAIQTVAIDQTGTNNDVDATIVNTPSVNLNDGAGNAINSTGGALDVNIAGGVTLDVNLDNANDDVLIYGFDGAANQAITTDVNGHLQIDILSSALPTGAATEATLSSIDGKITIVNTTDVRQSTHDNLNLNANLQVGDADVANGNPVPISDAGGSVTVDGTVTANAGTGTFTTDPTDRAAREVGRVSGNHTIHTEESYITTDTDANARVTNGDFNLQHHKTKTAVVRNTGANTARVNVLGSVDGGTNFDIVIANNTAVSAGDVLIVDEERAMTHMRIEARSAVAGNSTTIVTRGYSLGI